MSLRKIIQSLAEQPISVRGIAPIVYRLDSYPMSATTAQIPARLISGANEGGQSNDGRFVAIGKLERVNYQVEDLFLLRPLAQGVGVGDAEDQLVEYIDGYRELIRQWRNAGQSQAAVEGFTMSKGVVEFPTSSGVFFHAVTVTVNISEWYSGA